MPKFDRCVTLAAFGWLILAASPPEPKNQAIEVQAEQAADNLRETSTVSDEGCLKGQDNRRSDLCAQWKAADAAADSVVWAQRSFYLGIWALVVGLCTLIAAAAAAKFARDAAIETKRGANAAEQSVIDSKRLGEAQLVAYFSLTNVEYTLPILGNDIAITIETKNGGSTPAINHRAAYDFWIDKPGLPFRLVDDRVFHETNTSKIGPNSPVRLIGRKFKAGWWNIRLVRAGKRHLYISVRIEFNDINGTPHRIDFGRRTKNDVSESVKTIGREKFYSTKNGFWHEK